MSLTQYNSQIITSGSLIINSTTNASGVGTGGSLTVLGGASISKDLYVGTTITTNNLNIYGNLNTSFKSFSLNANNTIGSIITTGGNVGINTTSPGFTLDVNGTAKFSKFTYFPRDGKKTLQFNTNSQAPYIQLDSSASQYLDFGSQTFNIATNGGFTAIAYCAFTGSAGSYERIFDFSSSSSYGISINNNLILNRNGTNTYIEVNAANNTSWVTDQFTAPSGSIVQNKWNVVCVRYTHSTQLCEIIQDGITIASVTLSSPLTNRTFTRTLIGRSNFDNSPYSNLKIGGFYAYDKYLTDNQILNIGNRLRNENSLTVNAGNVGVGNSLPDYALDVKGNVRISGYTQFVTEICKLEMNSGTYSVINLSTANIIHSSNNPSVIINNFSNGGGWSTSTANSAPGGHIAITTPGLYQIDVVLRMNDTASTRALYLWKRNSGTDSKIIDDLWIPQDTYTARRRNITVSTLTSFISGDSLWIGSYGGYINQLCFLELNVVLISV